ncbi:MAG: hypothetical protein A4E52_01866 [Pelotomaculum sp. PtaB.Bin013]|uniref:Uncharacterized protein n=1 Tax=Pelotomaculum isophthalicicum JI TaxID=947010 RepID=A0A9X4GZR0_9FIRM|nr:hypothetical protein [Pelotomaculum isophthalicicum]MDF9409065.1 hypothetical protein [Pelotomaculum isophthalicicum JI]OPX83292.1 MAG: hypothetical protein A4E52_01866 [Pelotomaculum sp. PtaB.Bin013]
MENQVINITKNNKLYLYNSNRLPSEGFTWYRGKSVLREVEGIEFLSINNVQSYTPDLKSAVIDFANLNILDNKEIISIVKKYGFLGLVHFLEEGKGAYFWKTHHTDFDWYKLLGIDEPSKISTPFTNGLSSSAKHPFWDYYREPLEVFQNVVAWFQEIVSVLVAVERVSKENPAGFYQSEEFTELRWITQKTGPLSITLSYLPNGLPVWVMPVNSLLTALYSFLFWMIQNSYPIRQCPTCGKYFWADDKQHRKLYCNKDCAMNPVREREKEKRKVIRQSKKKTGEEIAKDTGIPLNRIKEILGEE